MIAELFPPFFNTERKREPLRPPVFMGYRFPKIVKLEKYEEKLRNFPGLFCFPAAKSNVNLILRFMKESEIYILLGRKAFACLNLIFSLPPYKASFLSPSLSLR